MTGFEISGKEIMTQTTTDRFDPHPDQPYGRGEDGEIFQTKDEAQEYMHRTFLEAKAEGGIHGKRVRVTNPSRKENISHFVSMKIESALEEAMNELTRAVEDGDATEKEIRDELWSAGPDLEEMFDEWMEELDG